MLIPLEEYNGGFFEKLAYGRIPVLCTIFHYISSTLTNYLSSYSNIKLIYVST